MYIKGYAKSLCEWIFFSYCGVIQPSGPGLSWLNWGIAHLRARLQCGEYTKWTFLFCTCASLSEGVLTVEQRAAVRSGTATASYIRSLRSLSVAVVLCYWRVPSNSRILKTILAAFPLRTGCKLKFWSSWVLCRALCVCLLCHVYWFRLWPLVSGVTLFVLGH